MPATPRFKVEHVERALRQSHGLIHPAANLLKTAYGSCTPATVRNYLKRHPTLRAAVEETIEFNLDLAETKLLKAIDNSAPWAIVFYLKTKGRQRGYVERVGYVDKNDQPSDGPPVYVVVLPDNGRDKPEEDE